MSVSLRRAGYISDWLELLGARPCTTHGQHCRAVTRDWYTGELEPSTQVPGCQESWQCPLSAMKWHGLKSHALFPQTLVTTVGRRAGLRDSREEELVLPLTHCSTGENKPCTSPRQHNGPGPGSEVWVSWPCGCDSRRAGPAPCWL